MRDGGMVQSKAVVEESRENLMKTLSGRVPWLKQKSVPHKSKMPAKSNFSQVNGSSSVVGSIKDDEYYITGFDPRRLESKGTLYEKAKIPPAKPPSAKLKRHIAKKPRNITRQLMVDPVAVKNSKLKGSHRLSGKFPLDVIQQYTNSGHCLCVVCGLVFDNSES